MQFAASDGKAVTLNEPKPTPCSECPWRVGNWGKTDTDNDEFYTPQRRFQMWDSHPDRRAGTGVRHGTTMVCHQGAPCEAGGCKDGSTVAYECTGARILVDRELWWFHGEGKPAPGGLTLNGIARVIQNRFGLSVERFRALSRPEVRAKLHDGIGDGEISRGPYVA